MILGLVVFMAAVWFYFGGGMSGLANKRLSEIKAKVATDQEAQYNIAAAQGDKVAMCVQAGMVAAAYLQAQDASAYNL